MNSVWIVDDDASIRWVLEKALTRENISCELFSSVDDVLAALEVIKPNQGVDQAISLNAPCEAHR